MKRNSIQGSGKIFGRWSGQGACSSTLHKILNPAKKNIPVYINWEKRGNEWISTQERLEIDTLGECAILRQPKKFFTTQIKLKTKLLWVFLLKILDDFSLLSYKQQKFNLFREENEGYAKLVTELNQAGSYMNIYMNSPSLYSCSGSDHCDSKLRHWSHQIPHWLLQPRPQPCSWHHTGELWMSTKSAHILCWPSRWVPAG